MKRKIKPSRVVAGVLGTLIVLGLVAAIDAKAGDPVSRDWANRQAIAYAEKKFPGQTFVVDKVYGGQYFQYGAWVQSTDSPDTNFNVWISFWFDVEGEDAKMVTGRWNTAVRQGKEAAQQAAAILQVEAPEWELAENYGEDETIEIDLCWERNENWQENTDGETPDGEVNTEAYLDQLTLDAPFDPSILRQVPSRLCAQIFWDNPTEADMEQVLRTLKTLMEENGLYIRYYDIALSPKAEYDDHQAFLDDVIFSGPVAAEEITEAS